MFEAESVINPSISELPTDTIVAVRSTLACLRALSYNSIKT